jgi:DNA adenine methylase
MPKTPITYYGGKINMLKEILPRIPEHKIYTEAFFGGGAVFFAKDKVQSEIINDTNNMVVNFYEVCKTDFDNLKSKIESTLFSRTVYTVAWSIYRIPHLFNRLQQAWAFYIATNMGFACSVGSWGNDKYGKRCKAFRNKKIRFDKSITQRLETTEIENRDANFVITSRDSIDTFHYIDPPYVTEGKVDQGHYHGYTQSDYARLLDTISKIKGEFLLSSYPSKLLDEYVKKNGWYSVSFEKPISAQKSKNKEKKKRKVEVLTANYPI